MWQVVFIDNGIETERSQAKPYEQARSDYAMARYIFKPQILEGLLEIKLEEIQ